MGRRGGLSRCSTLRIKVLSFCGQEKVNLGLKIKLDSLQFKEGRSQRPERIDVRSENWSAPPLGMRKAFSGPRD